MPTKPPVITEAEAEVMEVLWTAAPRSAEDVAAALAGRQDWQLATVKTLLNRLLKKEAVSAVPDEAHGRRYLYAPRLRRAEWAQAQSLSLVDRLFDGSLAPLVAHFSSRRKLKAGDVEALKQLIAEYERKAGSKTGKDHG
ncbi:MAG: BlaI/MecI/CopY family transcriptional regulator [Paucibacter sp.]|nr:BlaI/MecI/CopY family transcriptional regulator [Roseateles sp.]